MKYNYCCWMIVLLLLGTALKAQTRKNIEIIDSLVTVILPEAGKEIMAGGTDTLNITAGSVETAEQNYITARSANFFKDKHFVVLRNYDPAFSFDGLTLVINNFGCSIEYSKPYSKKFLGRSFVRRLITVNLRSQLWQVQGRLSELLGDTERSEKYQDEIPESDLAQAESSEYYFSRGQRQGYSKWSSFIEPVVTATVVSLIVYLFFTQRS